jgi:hypothetical protein
VCELDPRAHMRCINFPSEIGCDKVKGERRPRKRVPTKVMWYSPIISRLKRLFRNKEHAKLMRWHKEERKKDTMLRHPDDGFRRLCTGCEKHVSL